MACNMVFCEEALIRKSASLARMFDTVIAVIANMCACVLKTDYCSLCIQAGPRFVLLACLLVAGPRFVLLACLLVMMKVVITTLSKTSMLILQTKTVCSLWWWRHFVNVCLQEEI